MTQTKEPLPFGVRCVNCDAQTPFGTEPCKSCGAWVCPDCTDAATGYCSACPERGRAKADDDIQRMRVWYGRSSGDYPSAPPRASSASINDVHKMLDARMQECYRQQAMRRAAFEERIETRFNQWKSEIMTQIADLIEGGKHGD